MFKLCFPSYSYFTSYYFAHALVRNSARARDLCWNCSHEREKNKIRVLMKTKSDVALYFAHYLPPFSFLAGVKMRDPQVSYFRLWTWISKSY